MKTIGENEIWSFFDTDPTSKRILTSRDVRKGTGHLASSYFRLATKVAELQFRNPDYVFMFRGQSSDHKNDSGLTTLKPSLFRARIGSTKAPSEATLTNRFQRLERAEKRLIALYENANLIGLPQLKRHRMLRWAILQHYEVCDTPLLDVTHSLRIAASFASDGAANEAFIYVLGIPNLSGAITASAEAGIQIIRLASVCPPTALRPHLQEGYLLGEYPDMINYNQKGLYGHHEIDFGRRLIAKFRIDPSKFWKETTFPKVARGDLYPSEKKDVLYRLTASIKAIL